MVIFAVESTEKPLKMGNLTWVESTYSPANMGRIDKGAIIAFGASNGYERVTTHRQKTIYSSFFYSYIAICALYLSVMGIY